MTREKIAQKTKPLGKNWTKDPAIIAAIVGAVGTLIAGVITGGFGLAQAMIGVKEPIKATQAKEATLTIAALVQISTPATQTPMQTISPSPTSTTTWTVTLTPTDTPTSSRTPTLTNTPTPTDTSRPSPTPTERAIQDIYPIAITEVMGNPCGEIEDNEMSYKEAIQNEYIEVFNYGEQPVDVEGLWITDGSDKNGNPDQIVPWSAREDEFILGSHLITVEAVIPPKGYAVILSPRYISDQGTYRLPYLFPRGTVILTVAEGSYLGDDKSGLEVLFERDPLVLYTGNDAIIGEVISTYGTPKLTGNPKNIKDDGEDEIPFKLPDCFSAERVDPRAPDHQNNWMQIQDGTPGRPRAEA